jgi:hypothetical protein
MHLSDDELKSLWQAETKPAQRTACLSSEQLVRAGEGKLAANEMAMVASHIEQCSECAEEYRLVAAVKDWASEAVVTHADAFVTPVSTTKVKERWWQKLSLPSWQVPAFAMAAIALLIAAWFVWRAVERNKLQPEIVNVPATPSLTITPSATPTATPEAPLLAQLQDGQRLVTLNQQGELTGVDNLSPAQQQRIRQALTTQQIERSPMLAGLKRNGSALMSGSEEEKKFVVTAPVGKVLLTERPTFRWAALPNATSYVVEIYDEQFNLVTASPSLTTTTWTMTQPLQRGALYAWQVKANQDGQEITSPRPPAPQAKFRILSQAKANEIAQARRSNSNSPLTLGLLYADAGLLDEAEAEFRALQQANPSSPIARRLLANVRALQR